MNIQEMGNQGPPRSPEEAGRRAAAQWEPPACPYPVGSQEANEWANSYLEGREAFSWNVRNMTQIGSSARWLSEAVSQALGISLGKSILHMGAESAVYFRIGFVLNDCAQPIPDLHPDGWRRFAMVVNRGLQGRTLADMGIEDETALERLAWAESRSFVANILEGKNAPAIAKPGESFTAELRTVLAWMGSPVDDCQSDPAGE